jgi:hypothetical protein
MTGSILKVEGVDWVDPWDFINAACAHSSRTESFSVTVSQLPLWTLPETGV